jgi:hypothetical protein
MSFLAIADVGNKLLLANGTVVSYRFPSTVFLLDRIWEDPTNGDLYARGRDEVWILQPRKGILLKLKLCSPGRLTGDANRRLLFVTCTAAKVIQVSLINKAITPVANDLVSIQAMFYDDIRQHLYVSYVGGLRVIELVKNQSSIVLDGSLCVPNAIFLDLRNVVILLVACFYSGAYTLPVNPVSTVVDKARCNTQMSFYVDHPTSTTYVSPDYKIHSRCTRKL